MGSYYLQNAGLKANIASYKRQIIPREGDEIRVLLVNYSILHGFIYLRILFNVWN